MLNTQIKVKFLLQLISVSFAIGLSIYIFGYIQQETFNFLCFQSILWALFAISNVALYLFLPKNNKHLNLIIGKSRVIGQRIFSCIYITIALLIFIIAVIYLNVIYIPYSVQIVLGETLYNISNILFVVNFAMVCSSIIMSLMFDSKFKKYIFLFLTTFPLHTYIYFSSSLMKAENMIFYFAYYALIVMLTSFLYFIIYKLYRN